MKKIFLLKIFDLFYLPQVPVIFSGTVEDNLKYFNQNSITKDDMVCALKKVNLWEYFNNQDGLVTELDESDLNLSEGQKQRLCLAKVFLNQYHLIVLDEFTSAIDQKSKNIILDAVKKIESIIIFITHDKETAEIADEVLELKTGKYIF